MAAEKTNVADEGARAFGVFLNELHSGSAQIECTEEFHKMLKRLEVVAGLRGTKGKAKGTFTLKIVVTAHANGTAQVKSEADFKAPKADRDEDMFWMTRGSNLTRKNQKQQELPLIRDVSATDRQGDVKDGAGVSTL